MCKIAGYQSVRQIEARFVMSVCGHEPHDNGYGSVVGHLDMTCSICLTWNFTGIKTIKNDRELGFFHFMVPAAVYYRSHRTHLIVALFSCLTQDRKCRSIHRHISALARLLQKLG